MYPEWTLHGSKCVEQTERDLRPDYLLDDLERYKKVLGKEFGISELLKIKEIEVKAKIAEAISDAPEYFMDQLGKYSFIITHY